MRLDLKYYGSCIVMARNKQHNDAGLYQMQSSSMQKENLLLIGRIMRRCKKGLEDVDTSVQHIPFTANLAYYKHHPLMKVFLCLRHCRLFC